MLHLQNHIVICYRYRRLRSGYEGLEEAQPIVVVIVMAWRTFAGMFFTSACELKSPLPPLLLPLFSLQQPHTTTSTLPGLHNSPPASAPTVFCFICGERFACDKTPGLERKRGITGLELTYRMKTGSVSQKVHDRSAILRLGRARMASAVNRLTVDSRCRATQDLTDQHTTTTPLVAGHQRSIPSPHLR